MKSVRFDPLGAIYGKYIAVEGMGLWHIRKMTKAERYSFSSAMIGSHEKMQSGSSSPSSGVPGLKNKQVGRKKMKKGWGDDNE